MDLQELRIDLMDHGHAAPGGGCVVHLGLLGPDRASPTCPAAVTGLPALREAALHGEAAQRVVQAAEPLLVRLAQEGGGPVQLLAVDFLQRRLLAVCLRDGHEASPDATRDAARALWRERGGANFGEVGEVPPHLAALRCHGVDFLHLASLLREVARAATRALRPRVPEPPLPVSDVARWEQRYQEGGDGWELWRPAPPLARYLHEHPPAALTGKARPRALVLGAGRGHEARLLARLGAAVTAVDFAPSAVAECRRLAAAEGVALTVREADLFDLPRSDAGAHDLLLEHTCFCAIDPARRDEYVEAAAALLPPGGLLLGLFYCHGEPGGPPFGATPAEIDARFAPRFLTRHREVPPDSVATRAGHELLVLLQRR